MSRSIWLLNNSSQNGARARPRGELLPPGLEARPALCGLPSNTPQNGAPARPRARLVSSGLRDATGPLWALKDYRLKPVDSCSD
jgi:hypothetical protein